MRPGSDRIAGWSSGREKSYRRAIDRGVSSPFYSIEEAAEAWAFCESSEGPRTFAGCRSCGGTALKPLLVSLVASEDSYKRLSCFFLSPLRSMSVREIWVPADERLHETVWESERTGP